MYFTVDCEVIIILRSKMKRISHPAYLVRIWFTAFELVEFFGIVFHGFRNFTIYLSFLGIVNKSN